MLMALLFVGGVMNVVWIALIGLLVLAEKIVPRPAVVSVATGVLLIAWGVATVAIGSM
jgi:predicted metal-binding membrane protein